MQIVFKGERENKITQRKLEELTLPQLRNLMDEVRENYTKLQIELWNKETDEILRLEFPSKFLVRYHPSDKVEV